jgi:hypothetical protein
MKIKMLNRMVAWRFELYQVENITRSRRTGSISVKFATKNIFGRDQMIKKKLKSKDLKTMNKFAKFLQERVSTMKMQIRSNTM